MLEFPFSRDGCNRRGFSGPDGQRQPHQRAAVAWGKQPDRSAVIVCYLADDG
jgi:hypothetical protein